MKKKMNLVSAFNTLYKDVVNNSSFKSKISNPEYVNAKDYVQSYYENLNTSVLEFLAVFMLQHPSGKIQFMNSQDGVGIFCEYDDVLRAVCFNLNGVMISDVKRKNLETQKGE